jgi:chitinase
MDGIDLDIEGGRSAHYGVFIKEMRRIMDGDQSKVYLLTGAPQCPYPDHFLGPGGQSGMYLYNNISIKKLNEFDKKKSPFNANFFKDHTFF